LKSAVAGAGPRGIEAARPDEEEKNERQTRMLTPAYKDDRAMMLGPRNFRKPALPRTSKAGLALYDREDP
jgi:hypothetical protein